MRVEVDGDRCESHQKCIKITDWFYLDENEFTYAKEGVVPPELEKKVRAAVLACPAGAIRIVEE